MKLIPIKTDRVGINPQINFLDWAMNFIKKNKTELKEGDILVISSKVLSYFERRTILLSSVKSSSRAKRIAKKMRTSSELIELAINEADKVIAETALVLLTQKNGILCSNSGVDTSNVPSGHAVLWPKDSFLSAKKIKTQLMNSYSIKKLSTLIIDSTCLPGRSGTVGITLGYSGIKGYENLKGSKDLCGNILKYSALNVVDSLATAANLLMGESTASIPLVIIRDYKWEQNKNTKKGEMIISPNDEMYPIR